MTFQNVRKLIELIISTFLNSEEIFFSNVRIILLLLKNLSSEKL